MESLAKNMNMNKNMNMESLAKPLVMAKLNICHGKTEHGIWNHLPRT